MSPHPFLDNAYGRYIWDIGSRRERPFKILAPIPQASFGDLFITTACVAAVASSFEHSTCDFIFCDGKPYLTDILSLYPFPYKIFRASDWSDVKLMNSLFAIRDYDVSSDGFHDFVFTPSMYTSAVFSGLSRAPLRFSPDKVDELSSLLMELGLDRNNWFCVLHWREPTYEHKLISNIRDTDPAPYLELIDSIIDGLGGSVVQLGHPEMARAAPRPGYVDLSVIQDSWLLQAFAMSRARFLVGGPSGATGMAHGFCLPSARVDALDWYDADAQDWILTRRVILRDGRDLRQAALLQSGLMTSASLTQLLNQGGISSIEQSSVDEIMAAVALIHGETSDIQGWRAPPRMDTRRPNRFAMPPPVTDRLRFVPLATGVG